MKKEGMNKMAKYAKVEREKKRTNWKTVTAIRENIFLNIFWRARVC
jgi:hypothetical protein